jgi:hypothetical protein
LEDFKVKEKWLGVGMEQDQSRNSKHSNHERYKRAESQLRLMNALTQLEILERRLKQIMDSQQNGDSANDENKADS